MKKYCYTRRQFRIAAGLILALSAPAIAQVPPLNLPGLPPPPGATNPATGSTAATAPNAPPPLNLPLPTNDTAAQKTKTINPTDMLPATMLEEAGVGASDDDNTPAPETAVTEAPQPTDALPPAPQAAASGEDMGPPPPLPFGATAPTTTAIGGLPVPGLPAPGTQMMGPPMPSAINMEELAGTPEIDRKNLKSWQKPLAPSRTYPKTKFNYKHVVLPASIYRARYSAANRHLPVRHSNEDLDKMFLRAVAKNDINGTRALLNTGRNVNQMNAYGDSALIVAVRSGAFDTARLLIARGANPSFYGQGGKTAFDYARQQGNNDLAKMLIKGS